MAKFKDIVKGTKARLRGVSFVALDGRECSCDLRLLSGVDDEEVLERAAAQAVKRGGVAVAGNDLYEFAKVCELVAVSAVDADSPAGAPELFFTNADEVRSELDRDRIAYLAERQAAFQATLSPLKKEMSEGEYWEAIIKISDVEADDDRPFETWGRSFLCSFARTSAKHLATSLLSKSSTTSPLSSESSDPMIGSTAH